jgi:hypothetical protein
MCPVCTVAVGVGLGLSRWLKIDDAISGLWIGAFILSFAFTLAKYTKKSVLFYFLILLATTLVPMWYYKIIIGIDKLVLGMAGGIILFSFSVVLHNILGKSHFPFQKVVIPVIILMLVSLILYAVT